NDLKS
ncbi:unnamed protein product, partial [Rotaria sp. Silwood1]